VRSFKEYGKLSGRDVDELRAGARIAVGEAKEDPLDFALWKAAKPGEPYWESPWGKGRPGWHLECSAMSRKNLCLPLDIHGGGQDLVFPHHENEIAQSEAANDAQFSKYWMHNAFLNINNKKMSKSEGNFFTVRDIAEKYDLQVLRFFMLSAHYRSPLNFSADLMEAAKSGLERIVTSVAKINDIYDVAVDGDITDEEKVNIAKADELVKKFEDAMEDDFNTADAIAAIFELVKLNNISISETSTKAFVGVVREKITSLCDVLGIITEQKEEILDSDIEALIEKRQQARKDRDFALADKIRDDLAAQGIILEDTRQGVKWRRA